MKNDELGKKPRELKQTQKKSKYWSNQAQFFKQLRISSGLKTIKKESDDNPETEQCNKL